MISRIVVMSHDVFAEKAHTLRRENESAAMIFVEDPLTGASIRRVPEVDTLVTAFHDVKPSEYSGHELVGLIPFTEDTAKRVVAFADGLHNDEWPRVLFVVCPHGRARGSSLAEGLARRYELHTPEGSYHASSVNSCVVDLVESVSRSTIKNPVVGGAPMPDKKWCLCPDLSR